MILPLKQLPQINVHLMTTINSAALMHEEQSLLEYYGLHKIS